MIKAEVVKSDTRIVLTGEIGGWYGAAGQRYGHVTFNGLSLSLADASDLEAALWSARQMAKYST